MIKKEIVRLVLKAENKLLHEIYENGMTPDDYTAEEYLEAITEIVTKKG